MSISLSVIVPNYNYAEYLPRCLDSIVSQSVFPDELLICDDASRDESMTIIEGYARKYPWIRVIRNERNMGVLFTIDRLITESRGAHILGVASDDEVAPGFLEAVMLEVKANPSLAMVAGHTVVCFTDRSSGQSRSKLIGAGLELTLSVDEFQDVPNILKGKTLANGFTIATFIRKDCWIEAMKHSMAFGPQADVCWRTFVAAKWGFRIFDEPGLIVYQREGTYSNQGDSAEFAAQTISNYLKLCHWVRCEDVRHIFKKKLRRELTKAWLSELRDIGVKRIKRRNDSANRDFLALLAAMTACGSVPSSLLNKMATFITIAKIIKMRISIYFIYIKFLCIDWKSNLD